MKAYQFIFLSIIIILCSSFVSFAEYDDVSKEDWFYEDVKFITEHRIMNGVSDNKFNPNGFSSRAMIVTMIYRLEGTPIIKWKKIFEDVEPNKWYSQAIIWAYENNIIKGFGNGLFKPNKNIIQEEALQILYHYAEYKNYDFSLYVVDSNKIGKAKNIISRAQLGVLFSDFYKYILPYNKISFKNKAEEFNNLIKVNEGIIPEIKFSEKGEINFIEGSFSDIRVTDELAAIESLYDIYYLMHFQNPSREFKKVYIEDGFFRFQQFYHNIPVEGYQLSILTNKGGKILSLSGQYYRNLDVDTHPKITKTQAEKIIPNSKKVSLCIYIKDDRPVLSWKLSGTTKTYYLNANTGEIITSISNIID